MKLFHTFDKNRLGKGLQLITITFKHFIIDFVIQIMIIFTIEIMLYCNIIKQVKRGSFLYHAFKG